MYLQLHLPVFAIVNGGQLLPAAKFSVTTHRNLISALQWHVPTVMGNVPTVTGNVPTVTVVFLAFYFKTRGGHCLQTLFIPFYTILRTIIL